MNVARFIEERRPDWEQLDRLAKKAGGGLGRLTKVDLRELGALYRQASSDLARAQSGATTNPELIEYLTSLVVRAHGIIYRPEPARLKHLWNFLSREFPQLVRQEWRPILLGIVAFAIPTLWCYLMAALDPQFIDASTPPGLRERLEKGELWVYRINPVAPAATSFIMTNNISVSFIYFALGMTFGAGTLLAMTSFGAHFGAISVAVSQTRMAHEFWAFLSPHGALEIPAIFIATGAGLILGGALLFPGDLKRKDALVVRGRVAVKLVLGCVPLLIVAGIIEGFFSPLPPASLPPGAKFVVGGALFALFALYILRAGTGPAPAPRAPAPMTNVQ